MAFIRSVTGLKSGRVRELKSGSLVFGRNPRCCDVVLDHFAVSREHARISLVDGIAFVEDLESRNGVLVNGRVLPAGPDGRQRLYSGDRIRIATFEFEYEEDPSSDIRLSDHESGESEILSTWDVSGDSSRAAEPADPANSPAILAILEELTTAENHERVLSKILDNLFQTFPAADAGAIFLKDEEARDYVPMAVRRRAGTEQPLQVSRVLLRDVAERKTALLTARSQSVATSSGEAAPAVQSRSIMCVPLIRAGGVLGLIQLESLPASREFTKRDLAVLGSVARYLAAAIETARLHSAAMQAQRTELEQRFRGLIEGSIQGILVHRQLQPLFVNEAYGRLHGYTVEELLGLPTILPLLAADDRERTMGCAPDARGGAVLPVRYETQAVRQDGSVFWLEKFVSVVDWVDGPAFQVAAIDVTDRKRAEEELRAAHADLEQRVARRTAELADANLRLEREMADRQQKDKALRDAEALHASELERSNRDLEQFAYSVSHDLQSPLRTIANYCQLLRREAAGKLGQDELELLDNAVEAAGRMKRLLEDLLEYSRVGTRAERFQPADTNTVVDEALRNLQAAAAENAAVVTHDRLPSIVCDATQLMMLFQNLIGNAIAYRREEAPRIHIAVAERPDVWEFLVRDNGLGIPAEHFERIFQVLQRLHPDHEIPGSGLGLAICRRIVERHGGRIWVESVPGEGSVFHFTLPKTSAGRPLPADRCW